MDAHTRRLPLFRRPRRDSGFTLLEIMVVVLIIGLVLSVVGGNVFQALFAGQEGTAKNQIRNFQQALDQYQLFNHRYPDSLEDLTSGEGAPGGEPYMKKIPLDPWGNEYHYETTPEGGYVIISYGADGDPGGEGKNADISSEDL